MSRCGECKLGCNEKGALFCEENLGYEQCVDRLQDALFEVCADRPQGKWLLKDDVFHCGCCGKESHFTVDDVYVYDMPLPDFCEKCGARMKGADDESD